MLYISDPDGMSRDLRKASIETINEVNRLTHEEFQDPEILTRISQYEMAYRMQISVPEVMSIDKEPEYIHKMYGTEPGKVSFANNVLLARKLVENGVRFVQLYDWGWDTHGTSPSGAIDIGLVEKQIAGVQISMAMNITVRHNSIYDLPRAGINVSEGTWGGHVIEFNDVFNTVLGSSDHGAFNSWGRDRFWHPNRKTMDQIMEENPDMPYLDAIHTTIIRNNRMR